MECTSFSSLSFSWYWIFLIISLRPCCLQILVSPKFCLTNINLIPLWEWTCHNCIFYVRQGCKALPVSVSRKYKYTYKYERCAWSKHKCAIYGNEMTSRSFSTLYFTLRMDMVSLGILCYAQLTHACCCHVEGKYEHKCKKAQLK